MSRKCAWCDKALGELRVRADELITHTICPCCTERVLLDAGLSISDVRGMSPVEETRYRDQQAVLLR
jgi:hypothetical protein